MAYCPPAMTSRSRERETGADIHRAGDRLQHPHTSTRPETEREKGSPFDVQAAVRYLSIPPRCRGSRRCFRSRKSLCVCGCDGMLPSHRHLLRLHASMASHPVSTDVTLNCVLVLGLVLMHRTKKQLNLHKSVFICPVHGNQPG